MTEKRRPGRPRTATPIRTKEGHSARVWVEREGERVRTTVKLGTKSKVVATARRRRLLAGEAPELLAEKSESFEAAAERVMAASSRKGKEKLIAMLRRHAFPVIGDLPVTEVTSDRILEVLAEVKDAVGGWTGSVRNMRNVISLVLGSLVARRVLPANEALRINFRSKDGTLGGQRIRKVRPPRPVLTDDEFERLIAFLAWEAREGPARLRAGALELLMLCLCARVFGMRTSDLHAWVWEMIDTRGFADGYVPRPKTDSDLLDDPLDTAAAFEAWRDEPRSAFPEALGSWLRLWWQEQGSPSSGAVFGCRRGKRAGAPKQGVGYVRRLRAALWRAGITRPLPGFEAAASDTERRKLCELQSGIPRRRSAVDFHSFRRASATAAGRAVVTGQLSLREAMALTHHKDPAVFAKYQAREERIVVPESAVPTIMAAPLALFREVKHMSEPDSAASSGKAVSGRSARVTLADHHPIVSPVFSHTVEPPVHQETTGNGTERQNSLPLIESLGEALNLAVNLALKEGDITSAKALLEVVERRRATLPDNVRPLDAARKGKS